MKKSGLKRGICNVFAVAFAVLIFSIGFTNLKVKAESDAVPFSNESVEITGSIVSLDQDVKAYASASEDADVLHEFKAGDSILISGQDGDFVTIYYAGETMFIKSDSISKAAIADSEEKAKELEEAVKNEAEIRNQQNQSYVDSFIRQEESQKRAMVWRIVIGALIVGLLIISVIIGVRSRGAGEEKEAN